MPTADELCTEAKAALEKKEVSTAIQLLEDAITLDSRHIPAQESLAGMCFLTKDYARAASLFKRISQLDPKNSGALVNAGAAYNKAQDFNEAIKILRSALAKDRRCSEAYYNLAIAHRGLNQLALAVSAYKEAIRVNPKFVEAYSNLANILLEMKNHSQAITNFRKALEIKPDFKKAQQGLKRAEEDAYQFKKSQNPFGRLVDMDEVGRQNQTVVKVIQLTSQQRFEDRDTVHKVSKECELLALELVKQIKEELSPSVLQISRLMVEEQNKKIWGAELQAFQSAARRFRLRLEKLKEQTDLLRKHEREFQDSALND